MQICSRLGVLSLTALSKSHFSLTPSGSSEVSAQATVHNMAIIPATDTHALCVTIFFPSPFPTRSR